MQQAKCNGILAHHFHGPYWCQIALEFESAELAALALPKLGAKWEVAKEHKEVLLWAGDSEALDEATRVLVSFGAEERKIASLAKSIDRGEPFECNIPVPDPVDPNQMSMFGEANEQAL